jgi:hypothetical protein
MNVLTLEQCNKLPIESLVIAVIVEGVNTPAANDFKESCPEKWNRSVEDAFKEGRKKATSEMCTLLDDTGLLSVPKEDAEFWNGVNAIRDLAVSFGDVKFLRPSVLYRCSDGTYWDLNGYNNNIYDESSLKEIKPFSDYFTRDQFRFIPAVKNPRSPNQKGIHIDMKMDADGFEHYKRDINF